MTLSRNHADGGVEIRIALTVGLPLPLFEWTAAHEWAHVFLISSGAQTRGDLLIEGFCEYVAYTYVKRESRDPRKMWLVNELEHRPGVYGSGLRLIRSAVRKHGSRSVTRAVVEGRPDRVGL